MASEGKKENTNSLPPTKDSAQVTEPPPVKMCCACPETKKARDECVLFYGEENCEKLIEAHKECLRAHGFNIV